MHKLALALGLVCLSGAAGAQDKTLNDLMNAARIGDLVNSKAIARSLIEGPCAKKSVDLIAIANQIVGPSFPVDLTADPELVSEALRAAQTAVVLDAKNADAHEALARALIYSGRYEQGIVAMKDAITLSTGTEMTRQRKETLVLLERNGPRTRRQDPAIDNWAFPVGYKNAAPGKLGKVIHRSGKGPTILALSLGYESSIFNPIVSRIKGKADFYLLVAPGMDGTAAPVMPPASVSFGERTWSVNLENAILAFIREKNLKDVVLIADDYAAPQVMMRVAERAPERVSRLILINPVAPSRFPRDQAIAWVDTILAPKWYKTVTEKTWREGMPHPAMLCRDTKHAAKWFQKSIDVPIPVLARYFSEMIVDDVLVRAQKLPQKILVVVGQDQDLLATSFGGQIKGSAAYWQGIADAKESNVKTVLVDKARALVAIDQPNETSEEIKAFLGIR